MANRSEIEVTLVGVKPLDWYAEDTHEVSPSLQENPQHVPATDLDPLPHRDALGQPIPKTDTDLKKAYVAFLRREIGRLKADGDYAKTKRAKPVKRADEKTKLILILIVALDDTSHFKGIALKKLVNKVRRDPDFQLDTFFSAAVMKLRGAFELIVDAWEPCASALQLDSSHSAQPNAPELGNSAAEDTTATRCLQDRAAQSLVPTWYGGKCVLSGGSITTEGAHIVPVRAIGGDLNRLKGFWEALKMFWLLPEMGRLADLSHEVKNILPLDVKAHHMWDRYCFALRPIEHPTDPAHNLYLQLVWMTDMSLQAGLIFEDWEHQRKGSFPNCRNMTPEGAFHPVRQGQVFLLTTLSPETHPLPSTRMLQMQFAVHKIMAGIRAAGALREIFSERPPDDDGRPTGTMSLSPTWEAMLDAAVEAGVLDSAVAQRWTKAFIQDDIEKLARYGSISLTGLTPEEAMEYGVYDMACR